MKKTDQEPVFLVGCVRSGTTMLRLMLSHHPNIAFHFESEFLVEPLVGGAKDPVGQALRDYQDFLRSDVTFCSSGLLIDESLSYRDLLYSFVRQKHMLTGKPIVGMTVHVAFEELPRIWPKARYIHLIRDGRDVSHSAMRMGWYGNTWAATQRWKDAVLSCEALKQEVDSDRLLDVRFEELVADSDGQLARICEFLGEPFDPAIYEYADHSSYAGPGEKIAASWREHLNTHDTRLVEAEIGTMLEKWGYPLSGLESIEVTPEMRRKLGRDNDLGRRRWRTERYGIGLLALDRFANRLGIGPLKTYTHNRMIEIRRRHLK